VPRKRIQFDDETWNALDVLAKDRMQDFQELADEAFSESPPQARSANGFRRIRL
jgi:hypothetical protein